MDGERLYSFIVPEKVIEIDKLYSIHYFENHKNHYFPGKQHDYWELIYVDRGDLIADTDWMNGPIHLEQGNMLLFRPMEFHKIYSSNVINHNLLVVTFDSKSPSMDFFLTNTQFRVDEEMRHQIAVLLQEARKSFTRESLSASPASLQRVDNSAFGSEQIVAMMVQLLLIRLIRHDYHSKMDNNRTVTSYVDNAIVYMKQNLRNRISMEDICNYTNISRSQLQKAFRQRVGTSVMHYLIQLRMEEAKFLIRTGDKNFTQIAEEFCYSSVHHFSTQFRKITGMSPSEYAESILSSTPSHIP